MKQYVGIARDHSGSMHSLTRPATNDYNKLLDSLKLAGQDTDIKTIVSVARFGGDVAIETRNASLDSLGPINSYPSAGGTPLFDAVTRLIDTMGNHASGDSTFLIMAITDGEENSSRIRPEQFSENMRKLQATDRWTFVFRVPPGYGRHLIRLGIPEGNIQEWSQTEQGLVQATEQTAKAIANYYTGIGRGVLSTRTFYSDMSKTSVNVVKSKMVDISSEVSVFIVTTRQEISSYLTHVTHTPYVRGTGFYQLTKTEKAVQDYKLIVVRNKKTGAVYHGVSARQILNLPTVGTIKLAPGDHGNWDIYIQSASTNRVLPAGTSVLYWRSPR